MIAALLLAISITPVGRFEFTAEASAVPAPDGLSGITWLGDDRYVAVSDRHAALFPLTIDIDPASGAIRNARLGAPIPLRDREGELIAGPDEQADREGVAFDAATRSVWIANERSGGTRARPSLARHDLETGRMEQFLSATKKSPLAIFQSIQLNRGFEAIARAADGAVTWTANERTLRADGAPADSGSAAVVRLVRFDRTMRVTAQHAYVTDPPEGVITFPPAAIGQRGFGVSDLLLTPEGTLLALERGLTALPSGLAQFANRIYAVDLRGATDVSKGAFAKGLATARGGTDAAPRFTPVHKERLFEVYSPLLSVANFEGMTLGPALADGSRSLILIADNDSGHREALYALRLAEDAGPDAAPAR